MQNAAYVSSKGYYRHCYLDNYWHLWRELRFTLHITSRKWFHKQVRNISVGLLKCLRNSPSKEHLAFVILSSSPKVIRSFTELNLKMNHQPTQSISKTTHTYKKVVLPSMVRFTAQQFKKCQNGTEHITINTKVIKGLLKHKTTEVI